MKKLIKTLTVFCVYLAVATVAQAQIFSVTTLTSSSSANKSVTGESVTFYAMVTDDNDYPLTLGTVQFQCDDINMGIPVAINPATGIASYTTSSLAIGYHMITALYIGYPDKSLDSRDDIGFFVDRLVAFLDPSTIYKVYGDQSFSLPFASGGYPDGGAYIFRSDNPDVAAVSESGWVTVGKVGEANIYVKQSATGQILESPESEPIKVVVSPRPVTVSGITATKEYDGTDVFTNAQIDITKAVIDGIVRYDNLFLSKTGVTGVFGPEVGTGILELIGDFSLTGVSAVNYILEQPTVIATITIRATPITVTARSGSSIYGESPANPGLSATGLIDGDTESVLTGLSNSFGINATTPVGTYPLSVVGNLTNPKYTVSSRNTGTWTVNKRPITITATDKTIYDDETPVLEYKITTGSLVNGDVLTGELYCPPPYTLGTHPITQGTLAASSNYDVTFIPGTLTVISDIVLVDDILVEGLSTERNGNSFSISSPCGANSVDINVNTDQPATIRINGIQQNPYKIDLPNYGNNTFTITVTTMRGTVETYTLTVYKSVPVDVAFYDRFADVLTVPVHVEGIDGVVNSVEWYHNGARLDRDPAKGYLEMKEAGAYHALLNGQYRTCEVIKSGTRSAMTMSVFPNPAFANQEVTVNIDSVDKLKDAQLQFHSLDGRLLKTLPVTCASLQVTTPNYSGVIVVKLIYTNGNEEVKLIVK